MQHFSANVRGEPHTYHPHCIALFTFSIFLYSKNRTTSETNSLFAAVLEDGGRRSRCKTVLLCSSVDFRALEFRTEFHGEKKKEKEAEGGKAGRKKRRKQRK